MRHLLTTLLLISAITTGTAAKEKIIRIGCDRSAETSFAIIADRKTFDECRKELEEYKKILEEEGLGTYIIASSWENPEQVKDQILKLASKKPRLEGVVLVGDIPVVLVRQGQFMTTAFKMNEKKYPEFESSVPSDRFYDDFDLEFDFIKKDEEHQGIFYYRLSEKGSQVLNPDIYSARMKVPASMTGDRYEIMRAYLAKVVRAHRENNPLDHLIYFAGHGYNSDCLTVWRQKPVVFRENFPYVFASASQNRFLNFRQKDRMKINLANELQRPETDVFLFSEHGAFDTQYINGTGEGRDFESNFELLKRTMSSMYRDYKGTEDEIPFIKEVDSLFHLPHSFMSDSAMRRYDRMDSLESADAVMTLNDIMKIRSNPRIVILNACYNGSFHHPEGYIAGCHVFGEGRCIAAQGNTVNVLQDKWEDKMIGLLSAGERIGMWQKEITFLESHLIGDPTFRFCGHDAEEKRICEELHQNLVFHADESQVWMKYLESPLPLLRSAGIIHLCATEGNWSETALELFRNDSSWSVRLAALHSIARYADKNTMEAIDLALKDPYETIVRTACRLAGATGNQKFIPELERLQNERNDFQRVIFTAQSSQKVIAPGSYKKQITRAADSSLKKEKRIDALRIFRNNRVPAAADMMMELVSDSGEEEEIRTAAAEVLGWYDLSVKREEITASLKRLLKNERQMPETVCKEIQKTIKRLEWE